MTTLPAGIEFGDVYSIFDYEFADGAVADSKYFVVMGLFKGQLAGFITTSKEKGGRKRETGCSPGKGQYPSNFYTKTPKAPFSDGTWVIMQVEWHEQASIAKKIAEGRAVRVHKFADSEIRGFRNCFERSPEWSPICAEYMYGGKK